MIAWPSMLMIGACGRNTGKTALACTVIARRSAHGPTFGVKVTTIARNTRGCPRGGPGCGVCSSLGSRAYALDEEKGGHDGKDTERMLAAGAARVLWLRVRADSLAEGAAALRRELNGNEPVVCESNSLRLVVDPGVFLLVGDRRQERPKPTAAAVLGYSDQLVFSEAGIPEFDPGVLEFTGWRWVLHASCCQGAGNSGRL